MVLLSNGQVLVSGGQNTSQFSALASAELYNPATGKWKTTDNMYSTRVYHTATLLNNGQVLVAGGRDTNFSTLSSAELYTP
jgi:N-acetylneuraminic acid mutarotase